MLSPQLALRLTLNSVSKVLSSTFATLSEAQATIDCESSTVAVQPFSAIPGPKPLPVIRNLLKFRKYFFTLDRYLEECSDKYGEIFKLEAPGRCSACMHVELASIKLSLFKVGTILSILPIPMPWKTS